MKNVHDETSINLSQLGYIGDIRSSLAQGEYVVNGSQRYTIQLTNTRHVNKPHAEYKQLLWVLVAPAHGDGTSIHAINIASIRKQTKSLSQSDLCPYCPHRHTWDS